MPVATLPLAALRVAEGKLAVPFDDAGFDPRSVILDVGDLERAVSGVDRHIRSSFGRARHGERTHVLARRAAQELLRRGDETGTRSALLTVLWLALNHPHHGDRFRAGLSEQIRRTGRAHLTVAVDTRLTWSFNVTEGWVDLHRLMEVVPADATLSMVVERVPDVARPPMN